ncbi:hypothetical protein KVT40_008388 [Elsinoe batatas]|uniref:Uncharacterized protein n=1 Tax=Elsinoe batatas TaxID=2601811 RepID=A0A8K0KTW0_9PEZI|nr:hypothetical protein KVT40_008388 [Elsinoe batatas]
MCFVSVEEEGEYRPSRKRVVSSKRYYSRSPTRRVTTYERAPRQSTTYVVQAPPPQQITIQPAPAPEAIREEIKITETTTKTKEAPPPPPPEMVEVFESASVISSSSSDSSTTKAKTHKSGKSRASRATSHHSRTSRATSVTGTSVTSGTTARPRSEYDIKEREWIRDRSAPRQSMDRWETYRRVEPHRGGYDYDPRGSRDSYHRRERVIEEERRGYR